MTISGYLARTIEPALRRTIREFPAVVLTGPRQAGKTTLLQHVLGRTHGYVSMDLPEIRAAATADPRAFMAMHPPPVIIDEVQNAPEILRYVKDAIDSDRQRVGQFVLTGSQNLLLNESISESLAGRTAMLRLLPFTNRELARDPRRALPWERARRPRRAGGRASWDAFVRGSYPEVASDRKRTGALWYASFVQTYLERDVRGLRQVGDLTQFQNFLRVLAARSGQLLNLTDVSRDLGVALNTAKAWLSVLEATYQVIVLRPYFNNIGKRLVKTPKVYLTDTGLLCYLTGLKDAAHASAGPLAGAIFETAVITEVLKTLLGRGEEPRLYFWRTSSGAEVDLVVDDGLRLIPIEIKASATPRPAMAAGIERFRADYGDRVSKGYLIHAGDVTLPLAPDVVALPFADL